jgi:DNA invertase Pin-like site-specific DNA recombinase
MERELIQERTRAGLAVARAKDRVRVRKRLLTNGKMEAGKTLLAGGTPPKDVAQSLRVTVSAMYRWLPAEERS